MLNAQWTLDLNVYEVYVESSRKVAADTRSYADANTERDVMDRLSQPIDVHQSAVSHQLNCHCRSVRLEYIRMDRMRFFLLHHIDQCR